MNTEHSLIPPEPIPAGADEFSKKVKGLLDGQAKDEATVSRALEGMDDMLDRIAAGLYSMASMLVGEGEDSIGLVETAVAQTDISGSSDADRSQKEQPESAVCGGDRTDRVARAREPDCAGRAGSCFYVH